MDYTSKQSKPSSEPKQQMASSSAVSAFTDNRISSAVQLQQQNIIRAMHSPNIIQKLIAEKDETLRDNFEKETPTQIQRASAEKPNTTGLPDNLKSGIENMSGYSMDNVKVHYNSDKPAQLKAHAYAQGTDIHVSPGQEQHLPHEAWHVVQQKQGRVHPTVQMKAGVPINDDVGLEHEADVMGARIMQQAPMNKPEPIKNLLGRSKSQVISRKTILQAGGTEIVEGEATSIPSATGPTSGKKYTAVLDAKVTRFAAMEAIRNKYSSLGHLGDAAEFINVKRVKTLARTKNSTNASINKIRELIGEEKSNNGTVAQGDMNSLLNQAEISLIDPFKLTATAIYDTDKNLSVDVFYSDDNKGYITKVVDSGKGVDASLALSGEGTLMGRRHYGHNTDHSGEKDQVGIPGTYSSMHHTGGSNALVDNIDEIDDSRTYEENEQGLDAYTKLIAEGGRWQSVAALGNQLRDDSKFFVRNKKWMLNFVPMVQINYITFENLWGIWKKFGTKFNVSDEVLRKYVLEEDNKSVEVDNWEAENVDAFSEAQDYNLGDETD